MPYKVFVYGPEHKEEKIKNMDKCVAENHAKTPKKEQSKRGEKKN